MPRASRLEEERPPSTTRAYRALRDAVVRLAATRPVGELSVSEVCWEAHVSRDSFYRLASSPTDVLADYLYEDHDVTEVLDAGAPAGGDSLVVAMRLLVQHVARNVVIYRRNVEPHLPAVVQDALLRRTREVIEAHVRRSPHLVPRVPADAHGLAHDAFVSYLAFAVLGATESLVRSGGIDDEELSVAVLRAAISPAWVGEA